MTLGARPRILAAIGGHGWSLAETEVNRVSASKGDIKVNVSFTATGLVRFAVRYTDLPDKEAVAFRCIGMMDRRKVEQVIEWLEEES